MNKVYNILLAALVAGSVVPANAQIVIDALPFPTGSGAYAQYNTTNEDNSNTAAIETLIGQTGANQTYDLTAITYEDTFTGTYTITDGATGPGAEIDPLDRATKTLILPFTINEDGQVGEGTIYDYLRVTPDASYNMGGYFEGTLNGGPAQFTTTRTPDGDPEFIFPMTIGSMWSQDYTETTIFGGSSFETDISKEYEVDGWGTMLVPTLEDPIEVLRVKNVETRTFAGIEFSTTCYDLRANGLVAANFCEGEFDKAPTATVTILNAMATDVTSDATPVGLRLGEAYPNPARAQLTLTYELPETGPVTLTVYDVLGRAVRTVVDAVQPTGVHSVSLGVNDLPTGHYIVRLQAGTAHVTRSLTVLR